ncbi:MAG TPA: M23 family metallopeptidase [Desulfotomaculum sp.]|nr:M23 family metallopeptidase [Desulfotomaculum sp.]
MAGLNEWPRVQPQKTGGGRRLLYQIAVALSIFLVLMGLREVGGPFGPKVDRGLRTVLTTEWNYQPVLERVVRHGLQAVGGDFSFLGEPAKPVAGPAPGEPFCLPVSGRVIRGYGWSKDPVSNLEQFHPGIDIEAPAGAPVKAVADGEVAKIGTDPALGSYILIEHGGGNATLYAQLGEVAVSLGQQVVAGEVIGGVGEKGDIAGSGLHFEYREEGRPVDPLAKVTLFKGSER